MCRGYPAHFFPMTMARVAVLPLGGYKPVGDGVVVAPLYYSDTVRGIVIPDMAKDPEPEQGIVVAHGARSEFRYPHHIVFRRYHSQPFESDGRRLQHVRNQDIVGFIANGELRPRGGHVLLRPDWLNTGHAVSPLQIDPSVFGPNEGTRLATVIALGDKTHLSLLNQRVVITKTGGIEVGFMNENLYLIHEDSILATLNE